MKLIVTTSLLILCYSLTWAQEEPHSEPRGEHKHHIAGILGATTNLEHKETALLVGIEYEYRLSDMFGFGFGMEFPESNNGGIIVSMPFYYHPFGGLKIGIGAVMASLNETEHIPALVDDLGRDISPATSSVNRVYELGIRAGLAYDIQLGLVTVSPFGNFDYINESASVVYGIALGMVF